MNDEYEYEYEYEYQPPKVHYTATPIKTVDDNWIALKQEQQQYEITQPIIKTNNIVAFVYANEQFQKGSLKLNVKRQDLKQELKKFNFTFKTEQPSGVIQKHYKLWDLLKTLACYNSWQLDRAYIYKPNNNEESTSEISLFRITQEYDSQYILIVNDWVFNLRSKLEANLVLSTVWKDRIKINDYCEQLQGMLK